MATTKYQVVQPSDLGSQFAWDSGTSKWKIVGTGVSTDANNVLTNGTDGSAFLSKVNVQTAQSTYTMAYNGTSKKIELTQITPIAGNVTPQTQVISSVDPIALQGQLDEITITNGSTITFTDQGSPDVTYTMDFSTLMGKLTSNTNSISLSGDGKTGTELKANLILDPATDNLIKVSVSGTTVSKNDILALLNSNTNLTSSVNTMTVSINGTSHSANIINTYTAAIDSTNAVFKQQVNSVYANVGIIELVNSANVHIGFTFS